MEKVMNELNEAGIETLEEVHGEGWWGGFFTISAECNWGRSCNPFY